MMLSHKACSCIHLTIRTRESRMMLVMQIYTSMLNSLALHDELDYWLIMGDAFSERGSTLTQSFFQGLSLEAASRVMGFVLGNHDVWVCGGEHCRFKDDSYGNAHMQWYAQDTVGADGSEMFDFSVDPDVQEQITSVENTIWYTAIGNMAMIGFCNAFSWEAVEPHFRRACEWIDDTAPAVVFLVGHWYGGNWGAPEGMGTEDVYKTIQTLPGCDKLGGKLKYLLGHVHANKILEKDTGFMLGAYGVSGVDKQLFDMFGLPPDDGDQLGLPILDTRNSRVKLSYFELANAGKKADNFDEILGCISAKGYSACEHYATVWLDQPLKGTCAIAPDVFD